jgi:hypothetical protein
MPRQHQVAGHGFRSHREFKQETPGCHPLVTGTIVRKTPMSITAQQQDIRI